MKRLHDALNSYDQILLLLLSQNICPLPRLKRSKFNLYRIGQVLRQIEPGSPHTLWLSSATSAI